MAKPKAKLFNQLSFLPDYINKTLTLSAIVLILVNFFYFSTWFVRHGEVNFHADVARDFLLLDELAQKKIVLIGPRSSTSGIFHGPLWTYLNFPAYVLGKGDAIIVEWYWILISAIFLSSSFVVTKKMFTTNTAIAFTLLLSGNLLFHTSALYNPHGALFLIPFYYFSMLTYLNTHKFKWLLIHFFLGGLIIQFQMAVGIPLVIISTLIALYETTKTRHPKHLSSLLILPVTLINFIAFEFRHDFNMVKAIIGYASPNTDTGFYNYAVLINERFSKLIDLQLSPGIPELVKTIIFLIVLILSIRIVLTKSKLSKPILLIMVYIGLYILLTFINKGTVLSHQIFPIFALTTLWVAMLISTQYKNIIGLVIFVVILFNLQASTHFIIDAQENIIGKTQGSWLFLTGLAKEIAKSETGTFGYFVYSPDVFAYSSRYALKFEFTHLGISAHEYQKNETTYIIASPAPLERTDLSYPWWRKEKVGIHQDPLYTHTKANGYIIEKYRLSQGEQQIPFDPLINIGIHFR